MLEIKNISYSYEDNKVLENINITLKKNQLVSILGGSGVGKTTLFNIISGILPIQYGEITIDGKNTDIAGQISYMLQKDMLFNHKTIVENVALPLIIDKVKKKEALIEANKLLKDFNLDKWADKYPNELSGGMKQRVALLRTYMFHRNIILLDEAFSALDAITRHDMHTWYLNLQDKLNLSTLIITHDIDEAVMLSDKIYVLANKPANVIIELDINIPKPRHKDVVLSDDFIKYKKILLNALEV